MWKLCVVRVTFECDEGFARGDLAIDDLRRGVIASVVDNGAKGLGAKSGMTPCSRVGSGPTWGAMPGRMRGPKMGTRSLMF